MGARVKSIKIEHQADVYREEANNFWSIWENASDL